MCPNKNVTDPNPARETNILLATAATNSSLNQFRESQASNPPRSKHRNASHPFLASHQPRIYRNDLGTNIAYLHKILGRACRAFLHPVLSHRHLGMPRSRVPQPYHRTRFRRDVSQIRKVQHSGALRGASDRLRGLHLRYAGFGRYAARREVGGRRGSVTVMVQT